MTDRRNVLFGIDIRALAAFRMGIGALLLWDLCLRSRDLVAHYTDDGVLPRELLANQLRETWRWSWHVFGGSLPFQACLFLVAGFAAIALAVGYRTRGATAVSWLMLVSLHVRNPLVINSGDVLLRVILFWSLFLPLGAVWSVDRRHHRSLARVNPFVSMATIAILLQVACMYWMSAYFKWHGVWLSPDGFQRVIQLDSYAKPFAYILLQYPDVLPWLGYSILGLEIVGPILAFSPFATKSVRLVVVFCFVLLHVGIELTLTVGLFSAVSLLAWTLFLPDTFWNRVVGQLPGTRSDSSTVSQVDASSHREEPHRVIHAVVALLIAFVAAWNLSTVRQSQMSAFQRQLVPVADFTGLRQKWNMFTRPPRSDGWYVVVARLKDGRTVDLLRDGRLADWESFRKPAYIYRRFPNHRWRKFYRNLSQQRGTATYPALCRYLGRTWNSSHDATSAAESVELHFMEPIDTAPGEEDRLMQRVLHEERLAPPTD